MPDKCFSCEKSLNDGRVVTVRCISCPKIFHKTCAKKIQNIPPAGHLQTDTYKCDKCAEGAPNPTKMDAPSLAQQLTDISSSVKSGFQGVNQKLDNIVAKVTALENWQKDADRQLEETTEEVRYVRSGLSHLADYNRRNVVEIHGIPHSEEENCFDIVKQIGKHVGVSIDDLHIDAVHRVPSKLTSDPIYIRFVNRWKKDELLQARRGKKLLVREVEGLENPFSSNRFYINESLTPEKRALAAKTRQYFKDKDCSVWSAGGKILIAKRNTNVKFEVTSSTDPSELARKLGV
jgi:hypothetical protein